MELSFVYILVAAYLLDLAIGDPRGLPHLIVGYGNSIAKGEKWLNRGKAKFWKGMMLTIILVLSAFLAPFYGIRFLKMNDFWVLELIFSILMLFYCLANKTLVNEGKAVFEALDKNGLDAGRKRLSWIVGRDTAQLNAQQIRKATFETMSENLSDGVIAPLFFFVCFGVPGAMAYKMINTLDSMIGYRNDRYEQFGKFAAILDDCANFIPARITALLILVVNFKIKGIAFVLLHSKNHSSPNAGYPEAALAYVLDCQFGGPNFYGGVIYKKPFIGTNDRALLPTEIELVSRINYRVCFVFVLLSILVFCIYSAY